MHYLTNEGLELLEAMRFTPRTGGRTSKSWGPRMPVKPGEGYRTRPDGPKKFNEPPRRENAWRHRPETLDDLEEPDLVYEPPIKKATGAGTEAMLKGRAKADPYNQGPAEVARKSAIQAKWKRPTTTPTFRERMKDAAINFKAGAAGAESVSDKNRTKAERLGSLYGGLKQKARDNVKGFVKGISTPADQHAAERKSIDRAAMSSAGDSRDPALRAMDSSPSDATDAAKMVARQGVKQTLGQEVGALTRNVGGKVRRAFGRTAKAYQRQNQAEREKYGHTSGHALLKKLGSKPRRHVGWNPKYAPPGVTESSIYARIGTLIGEKEEAIPTPEEIARKKIVAIRTKAGYKGKDTEPLSMRGKDTSKKS